MLDGASCNNFDLPALSENRSLKTIILVFCLSGHLRQVPLYCSVSLPHSVVGWSVSLTVTFPHHTRKQTVMALTRDRIFRSLCLC